MDRNSLLRLLARVQQGELTLDSACESLALLPFEQTATATLDHHRSLRTGLPEVIFAGGKTPEQTAEIFARLAASGVSVLATHASKEAATAVHQQVPQAIYNTIGRTLSLPQNVTKHGGRIAVICAGTSDLPVAEEASITAELFGAEVIRITDVGVAGLQRILAHTKSLRSAHCVIVCAGMEGALPSVVGGMVAAPVIAVPTSVGYGASFGGTAALLGMLNSCSPNIVVVNIDNGFGAAYTATLIARAAAKQA
ncbi:MAG: nickel pincer cofactor biosynthesis protein LarB [Acidobacteria bacterium]|nr:nickel pincer cofactor biosynthesis protein LarB [Acidobacteriota bacterium]